MEQAWLHNDFTVYPTTSKASDYRHQGEGDSIISSSVVPSTSATSTPYRKRKSSHITSIDKRTSLPMANRKESKTPKKVFSKGENDFVASSENSNLFLHKTNDFDKHQVEWDDDADYIVTNAEYDDYSQDEDIDLEDEDMDLPYPG